MHEIAATWTLSLSSSFMQYARENTFIAEYETTRLLLRVYKKSYFIERLLRSGEKPQYAGPLDMFILFTRTLTFFRIPAAKLSCPIFSFARLVRFLIFWNAIWKNYVTRSKRRGVMALSVSSFLYVYLIYAAIVMQPRIMLS